MATPARLDRLPAKESHGTALQESLRRYPMAVCVSVWHFELTRSKNRALNSPGGGANPDCLSGLHVTIGVRQAKLSSDVCEFVLVHVAPVGSEAPQRTEAPFGEVGSRQGSIGPDLHQATINHRQRRWQFGLSGQRATAPCSQLKAVSH